MPVSGKVAVVIGGARGIGEACVERLLREGAKVTEEYFYICLYLAFYVWILPYIYIYMQILPYIYIYALKHGAV